MNRTLMTALAGLSLAAIAGAQATGANGVTVHPYVFADFANSGFSSSGTFPGVTFNDPNVDTAGQGTGSGNFANRHIWNTSNNGGTSDYGLTGGNDFFNFSFNMSLTTSDENSRKEGGIFIHTGNGTDSWDNLDCQFILTTNNNATDGATPGEVAAFGGIFPFYSFTTSNGLHYTEGSTASMGVRYFQDLTDTGHTYHLQYMYNGVFSGSMRLANGADVSGLPTGTTLGSYLQIPKDWANAANQNGAHAVWSNISVAPVPEPATLTALGLGALAIVRRRRSR